MIEYDIKHGHTYNMDEKGFIIGVTGRPKRIFSKALFAKKTVQTGTPRWQSQVDHSGSMHLC